MIFATESTTAESVWSVSKTVYKSDGDPHLVDEPDANLDNSSDSMTTSLTSQPEMDLSGFDLNDLNMKDVYDEYDELNDDSYASEDGGDNDDGGKIKKRPNDHGYLFFVVVTLKPKTERIFWKKFY